MVLLLQCFRINSEREPLPLGVTPEVVPSLVNRNLLLLLDPTPASKLQLLLLVLIKMMNIRMMVLCQSCMYATLAHVQWRGEFRRG